MNANRRLRRGSGTTTRSMVANGDVALCNLGPAPFGVEILRVRLRRTLRMTPLGVGGIKKGIGAKMNRVVSSTLRYVLGQGRCAFPAQNPGHRPRRPKFLISSTEV